MSVAEKYAALAAAGETGVPEAEDGRQRTAGQETAGWTSWMLGICTLDILKGENEHTETASENNIVNVT